MTVEDSEGSLQSPHYPDNYPNDIHCEYFFPIHEPGFRVVFEFTSLDLEDVSANGSCVNDYVEVIQIDRSYKTVVTCWFSSF